MVRRAAMPVGPIGRVKRAQIKPDCRPLRSTLTGMVNTGSLGRAMEPRPLHALLRDLRLEKGRSLRAAARALDINPAYLSRIETGRKPASPAVLGRASDYYDVPQDLLALSRGEVPPDVVAILQAHPDLLEELRNRFGSD